MGNDGTSTQERRPPEPSGLRTLAPFLYAVAVVSLLGVLAVYDRSRNEAILLALVLPIALVAAAVIAGRRAALARRHEAAERASPGTSGPARVQSSD